MSAPTELIYEEHDHVGVVTLNRPAARNALTFTTYAELEKAVRTTTARVVPHEELLPTALGLGADIVANPPLAVQRMKQGLRAALDPDWRELGTWVSGSLAELLQTADHREGVAAFLEKREPRFRGQ